MYKLTNNISSEIGKNLFANSQMNMFHVLFDIEHSEKILNIWRSYSLRNNITESITYYDYYNVDNNDWWDLISYRVYGDVQYWWIVALTNSVINPFEELETGAQLKILKMKYVFQMLKEIKGVAAL